MLSADDRARSDALNVARSYIVQAPAGSGKTELLIQRFLRLLAVVEQPEDILAITFTRKAAQEMRLRVLKALRPATLATKVTSEHEQLTRSIALDALSHNATCGWDLIASPNRLRIDTVDAFAASVARAMPVTSEAGLPGRPLTDAQLDAVYRDAAVATLDHLSTGRPLSQPVPDSPAQAVRSLLVHLDNNTNVYIRSITGMLSKRDQWLDITGAGLTDDAQSEAVRARLEESLANVIDSLLPQIAQRIPDDCKSELLELMQFAAKNIEESGADANPFRESLEWERFPEPVSAQLNAWRAITEFLLTKDEHGKWRKTVNVKNGFPPTNKERKAQFIDLLQVLRRVDGLEQKLHGVRKMPLANYSDSQWSALRVLFRVLPLAVAELRRLFAEIGCTDHTEIAMAANRALGEPDLPGDIALMLDYRIQHLLIDEMQDTSASQYGLLTRVIAGWEQGDGRTLFCVGDPMQSIYGFRKAEVGEFLMARRHGIGQVPLQSLLLRRNFRSDDALVHWFNTVFGQIMPVEDELTSGAIAYSEAAPAKGESTAEADKAANTPSAVVHPLFSASESEEATLTRQVIQQCLVAGDNSSIAVLVRGRTQLRELLVELREAKINFESVEIDRLTDLPEIIDLLALTRALSHDADRLAWLSVLRGPCVGLSWGDIHALVRNDREGLIPELMRDADRVARLSAEGQKRLSRTVQALVPFRNRHAATSLRDRIEAAWFALGGPATLTDRQQLDHVYQFLNALSDFDVAGSVEDVVDLERRLDELKVSATGSGDGRLQIMTMHKSKGLQFDHVILHGLGRRSRPTERAVLNWIAVAGKGGESDLLVSPIGARGEADKDPIHEFIHSIEDAKAAMELDRLLYVACTRARASLHLIGSVSVAANGEDLNTPSSNTLLGRMWPAVKREYQQAFEHADSAGSARESDKDVEPLCHPQHMRFVQQWQPPLPPALPVQKSDADTSASSDTAVDYYWVGAAARHAGVLVHRWLQHLADRNEPMQFQNIAHFRTVTGRWIDELGVDDVERDTISSRAEDSVRRILEDPKGRWILFGDGHAEFAVTGLYQGRLDSIVIDRIKIDDDGTHWIVDYKTSVHEGGDRAGFIRQEVERYRPQLSKYAAMYSSLTDAPVKTALYFPMLTEFSPLD